MKKTSVNVAEAQRHLAALLGRVAYGGETITIMRRDKLLAFDLPEAVLAGDVLAHLSRRDELIGVEDLLIGAAALGMISRRALGFDGVREVLRSVGVL